jgi:transcriptional regulator with XRE-family HTH domain
MAPAQRRLGSEDEIALTITVLRLVRGWNQDDLAKASGIGNSAISDYERSHKVPELATLNRFFDAMGFPLAAIDLTRQYIQTLRAGGSTLSAMTPVPMAAPAPLLTEAGIRWEIAQAIPDSARAFARLINVVLLLLLRCSRFRTEDDGSR